MKKVYYFEEETDDLVKSKNQEYILKDNYKWIKTNSLYILLSYIVYYIVLIVAFIYSKLILKVKYKNISIKDKGCFIYSNHTLTFGDIFNPFLECFPHRPYIICSSANLGIPIIGKILPLAGALPIPSKLSKYKEFYEAIKVRSNKHPVIIYPEAHLWPYYTKIREFGTSSFHYPVELNKPSYVFTTTYVDKKIIIQMDGPINIKEDLSRRENIKYIHDEVYNCMLNRSKLNNYNKCEYVKKK